MDDVVFHRHAVRRYVPVAFSVEVDFPHVKGVFIKVAGNLVDDILDTHHPLGAAKTPEGHV